MSNRPMAWSFSLLRESVTAQGIGKGVLVYDVGITQVKKTAMFDLGIVTKAEVQNYRML